MKKKNPTKFILCSTVPVVVLMILFIIIPTLKAFRLSFTNSTGMSDNYKFVGLSNYKYMFQDEMFILALKNTFKLMVVVPIIAVLLALIFAFILTQSKLKEKQIYRVIFFMPSIISLTVIGVVFVFIFSPTSGPLNSFLKSIGLSKMACTWLGSEKTALGCLATTLIWQCVGYYMVMHIAGIDGISSNIMEAATIDGASQVKKMLFIILPLLKDIVGITYVLALSGTLVQSFTLSKVMTGGGPSGSTTVLLQYMHRQAFMNSNFGYAMAIAVFSLAISVLLSLMSRKVTGREDVE